MKIECSTEELNSALKRMSVPSGADAVPILKCVLLQAEGASLKLTASGFVSETEIEIDAKVESPGGCAVPMVNVSGLVARFDKPTVSLLHADGGVKIKSGRSNYELRTIEVDEFPKSKPIEGAVSLKFESGKALAEFLRPVTHAAAVHTSDIAGLTGIRLHVDNGRLCAAATDRHNLARNIRDMDDLPADFTSVIPGESAQMMASAAQKVGSHPVEVLVGSNYARLLAPRYAFTMRLLKNEYPDYQKVLPTLNRPTFKIAAPDLLGAIERLICVIPSDKNKPQCATFVIGDGAARITYVAQDGHQADEELEASDIGDDRSSTLHLPKLATAVGMWGDADIDVHITSGRHFTMVSESNPDMLQLVMAQNRA
jgi:DNA polymerase III subunit beta